MRDGHLQLREVALVDLPIVLPEHRRQGLARRLMEAMIAWTRREGYAALFLHASETGRPLYEELGFEPTNEMRLKL